MKHKNLEEQLYILLSKLHEKPRFSVREILTILSGKGRFLLLIILSIPFCQPIHIPGLSTPFGILIAFIGFRIAFGKHVWLPRKVMSHCISSKTLRKISQIFLKVLKGIRFLIRPRFIAMCIHKTMKIFHGLLIVILGILLALPFPVPLANFIPAWAVFFIGIGLFENDGIIVSLGYLLSFIFIFLLIFVFFSAKFAF